MQFRDATINDLSLIVEIYNSIVPGRMVTADTEMVTIASKQNWFNLHNAATRPLWMVEENNQLIGWVSYTSFYGRPAYNGTAEISIYLHETARGKGYGKKILQYCIQRAPALHIHTLLGFIFSHNKPSIVLFTNAGFAQWGLLNDVAVMDDKYYSLCIFGIKI